MYKQQYTINGMDVLRIVAMTMVLVIHWGQFVFADGSFIRKVTNLGGYGVPIFFAMSGFLITLSLSKVKTLDKRELVKFYLKRFFRIVPLYCSMIVIAMITFPMPEDIYGLYWLRFFLFLEEIVPAESHEWVSICGWWCMSSFMAFYLLAPLFKRFFTTFKSCIILILLLFGRMLTHIEPSLFGYRNVVNCLPMFTLGCTAYYAWVENRVKSFVIISFSVVMVLTGLNLATYQVWAFFGSVLCMFLINSELSTNPHWPPRVSLGLYKILKYLSSKSFTIFLCHFMVLYLLHYMGVTNFAVFTLSFLMLTLFFAHLLSVLVEEPVNNLMKRIINYYITKPNI